MAYPGQEPGLTMRKGPDRVLSRDTFLYFLDLEVKRSRRYQNFFSILILRLAELHHHENSRGLQVCIQRLAHLLMGEMRDSDILGALEESRLAILLPYADLLAGGTPGPVSRTASGITISAGMVIMWRSSSSVFPATGPIRLTSSRR